MLGVGPPWAPGRSLNGARMTFFEFSHTSTGHSFQAIDTKFFMQIALLVQQSPLKNLEGRTPLGENLFQNFFQDIDLQICVSHAPDPGKNKQKKCWAADPPGLRGLASKVVK